MKCIRCECPLPSDFTPLDEHGAYSLCGTCFETYLQERGWPDYDECLIERMLAEPSSSFSPLP